MRLATLVMPILALFLGLLCLVVLIVRACADDPIQPPPPDVAGFILAVDAARLSLDVELPGGAVVTVLADEHTTIALGIQLITFDRLQAGWWVRVWYSPAGTPPTAGLIDAFLERP